MKNPNPTPMQLIRRKYEELHKQERLERTKQFNTRIPTEIYNEINAFLQENHIKKVDVIYAGYSALLELFEDKEDKTEDTTDNNR